MDTARGLVQRPVLVLLLVLVLGSCSTFRLDSTSHRALIPGDRNLYMLMEARQDPRRWLEVAARFGLAGDLAGRVDQVCLFDIPPGGNLVFLTGDFPRGLTGAVLGSQGWKDATGSWPWKVLEKDQLSIALLADGALMVSMVGPGLFDWYAAWQQEQRAAPSSSSAVSTPSPDQVPVFAASGSTAFIRVSSRLSAFNSSFHSIDLSFSKNQDKLGLGMKLTFQQDLEERKAKSAARLFFLQTVQVLGMDPGLLTASTLEQSGRSVSLSAIPVSDESFSRVLDSLAQQADIR